MEKPQEVLAMAREQQECEQAVQQLELQEEKEKEREKDEEDVTLDLGCAGRKCMTLLKKKTILTKRIKIDDV